MHKRALVGREKAFGWDHTSTLDTVYNLGLLYKGPHRLEVAEATFKQALVGYEEALGPDHESAQ